MKVHAEQLNDAVLWRVWHCQQCRYMHDVQWADDELHLFGKALRLHGPVITVQARRIVIIPEARIVYINPPMDMRDLVIEEQEALCQS